MTAKCGLHTFYLAHFQIRYLSVFNKEIPPKYEALSYAWGSITAMRSIQITSKVDSSRESPILPREFPISENLEIALRYLRGKEKPRALRIHAICIDQKNLDERGAEVSRMGILYNRAWWWVVVWLDISEQNSQLAFDAFTALDLVRSASSK